MEPPTYRQASEALELLDGHPIHLNTLRRFIDMARMKNMTHEEQKDLADAVAKAPWNVGSPDYLLVHRDVVEALGFWQAFWGSKGPREARANNLWREINTNPLPAIPEKPRHERILALLGDGWSADEGLEGRWFFHRGKISYPVLPSDKTPAQIADALRVLAGEETKTND